MPELTRVVFLLDSADRERVRIDSRDWAERKGIKVPTQARSEYLRFLIRGGRRLWEKANR